MNGLAVAALAIAIAIPLPCLAHIGAFHAPQQRHGAPPPASQRQQAPRQQQGRPQPRGHAGDWLRRYKDLPPAEQERELQNDPAFRRLPPQDSSNFGSVCSIFQVCRRNSNCAC